MKKLISIYSLLFVLLSGSIAQTKTIGGYSGSSVNQQFSWEEKYDQQLKASNVDKLIKDMSAKPHNIGSPGSKAVAEYIQKYFQDLGYDSKIEVLYTLFSTPKERLLEMTGPSAFKASPG
jgi:N-acetylated-alpha-linked acidic dipeptidase